jgi:hypothetical protein
VNAYAELDPRDNEYWVNKRIGIAPTPSFTATVGFPMGAYRNVNNGNVLYIVNNVLYDNGTLIGNLYTRGGNRVNQYQYWFETIGGGANQIVIMNSSGASIYAGGVITGISDLNFPAFPVPGWAYLDGTLYAMDLFGNIWGSKFTYNPTVWDGLNVVPASTNGDFGVFLTAQLTYVIAMKQWSTQVFYDAQNTTGSPLSPVPDAQIPYGCLHANSVQKIDEVLFWLSSNKTISPQIIMMENLSARIISTPSIDRLLDNIQINTFPSGEHSLSDPYYDDKTLFSWSLKHAGHRFYGLTHTLSNFTIVYDMDQRLWYLWTDYKGNYWPCVNFTHQDPTLTVQGTHFAQMLNNVTGIQGQLYAIDGDYEYANDCGKLAPTDIYTPNYTGGTIRTKSLNMMYFESDQTPGSVLQARYSDDDYKTWSNFRKIDLGYDKPYLDQEGSFTKRAYHFRHQCNTPFRIKASELQIDIGTL